MVKRIRKFDGMPYYHHRTYETKKEANAWRERQPRAMNTRLIKHKDGYSVYYRKGKTVRRSTTSLYKTSKLKSEPAPVPKGLGERLRKLRGR
jgi:hypothetical protein